MKDIDLLRKDIARILEREHIEFLDEHSLSAFVSHIESFGQRIIEGEILDDGPELYEGIIGELGEEAMRISEEIVQLFPEHSMMEKILIATHIQTSMNQKKEREA